MPVFYIDHVPHLIIPTTLINRYDYYPQEGRKEDEEEGGMGRGREGRREGGVGEKKLCNRACPAPKLSKVPSCKGLV